MAGEKGRSKGVEDCDSCACVRACVPLREGGAPPLTDAFLTSQLNGRENERL